MYDLNLRYVVFSNSLSFKPFVIILSYSDIIEQFGNNLLTDKNLYRKLNILRNKKIREKLNKILGKNNKYIIKSFPQNYNLGHNKEWELIERSK
jgi:hypothetical protein